MGSIKPTTSNSLPPLQDLILPTPETYAVLLNVFQWFPLLTTIQWLTSWRPAGRYSYQSSLFNIPGRLAWSAMELVGPINLIYILYNLPAKVNIQSLPLSNKLLASLYLIHYANRAVISPLFAAPSMSPMHASIVACAMLFNWFNSSCLACWLVGYNVSAIPGPYPDSSSAPSVMSPEKVLEDSFASNVSTSLLLPSLGLVLFFAGMAGNIYTERTLFSLRRAEADKRQPQKTAKKETTATEIGSENANPNKYSKIYVIPPKQGLFKTILYPHYVFEWLEWTGFALAGLMVFPALNPPPSLIPDVLSTSASRSTLELGLGASGSSGPLRLAPWLVPAVWVAGKLRVPVLPLPAIIFLVNVVATTLPQARWGRKWYIGKFGEKAVGGRGAVVPFWSWM